MWIKLNRKWCLYLSHETTGIGGDRIRTNYAFIPTYTRDSGWIWQQYYHYQEIEYYMPGSLFPKWIKVRPHVKIRDGVFSTLSPYVLKKENLCSYKISLKV